MLSQSEQSEKLIVGVWRSTESTLTQQQSHGLADALSVVLPWIIWRGGDTQMSRMDTESRMSCLFAHWHWLLVHVCDMAVCLPYSTPTCSLISPRFTMEGTLGRNNMWVSNVRENVCSYVSVHSCSLTGQVRAVHPKGAASCRLQEGSAAR